MKMRDARRVLMAVLEFAEIIEDEDMNPDEMAEEAAHIVFELVDRLTKGMASEAVDQDDLADAVGALTKVLYPAFTE